MATYGIGDIQGCNRAFARLLDRIGFRESKDRLWLVGDLVNRGPDSLGVLRRVMQLGSRVRCVLGNHDLHLLAIAAGVRSPSSNDTMDAILDAPDADDIIDWLRRRPILYYDEKNNRALVHAGIPPAWRLDLALKAAASVEDMLAGNSWKDDLSGMYGNFPRVWSKSLTRKQRMRYTINALTRMRFCHADGRLDFGFTGPPGSQPKWLVPWFRVPERAAQDTHIVFGHWAALGVLERKNITALDSGCVWGRSLTAIALKSKSKSKSKTRRISVRCRR